MASRAHLRLVGPEQEDEQRLREAAGERRSLHLRSDESPDGEEIGPLMRVLRQFRIRILRSSTSDFTISANFAQTEFSEVQLEDAERLSVRRVMSSSCSHPSPTKE